ncbi:MAG: lytic transglycosylase domain-containing protein [Variovorax sp.]|nr:MAG: lytic transglycosylase domain-containing protein [Variovorax sp.]
MSDLNVRGLFGLWRPLLLCALLSISQQNTAHAADIYGYVDERGTAHFAAEKLDARYQLFFRGGQSFDTAEGLGRRGAAPGAAGKVPPASQTLIALFEASSTYKSAKAALREASQRHGIDYELLQALVAAESGFDAQAVSPKGAIGLMQLMPATAQRYGVQGDKKATLEKKLFDPRINIAAGSRYLRDLIAMFQGDLELAVAAYNAGEGAVQRAGNRIPNYKETQNYVKTVLQLYAYLKPGGAGVARGGGKAPGRVKMEIGGAVGRGNMPPSQPQTLPAMPEAVATPPTSPYMPTAPDAPAAE